jgi:muramoyltetrapeptide carboxypeptidase
MTRIAICAPATPITRDVAREVQVLAAAYPALELHFHEQCFAVDGHFAGSDAVRLAAFLECANDPTFDAVWCAKGGYGSNRIAADVVAGVGAAARDKLYLGYSDFGYLLAALHRAGIGRQVHAPMPVDLRRDDGAAAIRRVLGWLEGDGGGLEPSLDETPAVAFNLITLAMLCGTDLLPDLTGHVVMVEEVAEHLYAVDRLFFHISQHLQGIAGLRLGRVSAVPENDREFGASAEDIARHWCAKAGIAWLGRADIGHDSANRIVPFGLAGSRTQP